MVEYVPIKRGKGKIRMAVNIDMKLNFIPLWIIEMVSKKFCTDFFDVIMKVSSRYPGSKW